MRRRQMPNGPLKTIYSLVLAPSGNGRELRAFCFSIGQTLPGVNEGAVIASRKETNLPYANTLDGTATFGALEWRIPSVIPAVYQLDPRLGDYTVTKEDVGSFIRNAHLMFFCGGDKPIVELEPLSGEVDKLEDEAGLSWGQRTFFPPWTTREMEKLWVSISWPRQVPVFGLYPEWPKVGKRGKEKVQPLGQAHGTLAVMITLYDAREC